MKNNRWSEEASRIVSLLNSSFKNDKGIFVLGIDEEGRLSDEELIDDFGDFAPFLSLYGGEEVCRFHIDYINNNNNSHAFDKAFAYTDLLLGLIWYSRIGEHGDEAVELATKLGEEVYKNFYRGKSVFSTRIKGITIPITNGIDSTFVEVWTEMYRQTSDKKYLNRAFNTFEFFDSLCEKYEFVPKHHVHFVSNRYLARLFPRRFNAFKLMKDNTNYGFGILDLYRITNEDKFLKSFDRLHANISNLVASGFCNKKKIYRQSETCKHELLPSFAYIDMSCDAYMLTGDNKYLEAPTKLANVWLESQSVTTGLMPESIGRPESYFDSETDMAVALLKLYECTSNERFLTAAQRLTEGVYNYHRLKDGYCLQVNIDTNEVVSAVLKTKFIALYIKILHLIQSPGEIYKDSTLFMIAKDR